MFELSPDDERKPEDLLTRRSSEACLSEIELEDFLHNKLSGTTRECVEEHLLFCRACLDRVEEEEQFASSFRAAARRMEEESLKAAFDGPRPGAWVRDRPIRTWRTCELSLRWPASLRSPDPPWP